MGTGSELGCELLLTNPATLGALTTVAGRPDVILMILPGNWCTALVTLGGWAVWTTVAGPAPFPDVGGAAFFGSEALPGTELLCKMGGAVVMGAEG